MSDIKKAAAEFQASYLSERHNPSLVKLEQQRLIDFAREWAHIETERANKADGMANEINILVKENRELKDRVEKAEAELRARIKEDIGLLRNFCARYK